MTQANFDRPRIWKESDETLGELSAKQLLVEVWEFVAIVFVFYRKVMVLDCLFGLSAKVKKHAAPRAVISFSVWEAKFPQKW